MWGGERWPPALKSFLDAGEAWDQRVSDGFMAWITDDRIPTHSMTDHYFMGLQSAPPQLHPPQKNKNIKGMQQAVKVNKPLVSGY